MSAEVKKTERIKIKDRPFVQYTDLKFVNEHGTPVKSGRIYDWLHNHKIAGVALLILFIILYAFSLSESTVSIPAYATILFLGIFSVVEFGRSNGQKRTFYRDLLKRGGVIIDQCNNTLLESSPVASLVLLAIICASAGFFIWYRATGREVQMFASFIPLYLSIMLNMDNLTPRGYYSGPTIFLDIDEGVLFGGAIFPYEVLRGLSYNSRNDNSFKLTYEGKDVATGKILPEDWAYLHSMIVIGEKYRNYLISEN
jgi:hypothetical protein